MNRKSAKPKKKTTARALSLTLPTRTYRDACRGCVHFMVRGYALPIYCAAPRSCSPIADLRVPRYGLVWWTERSCKDFQAKTIAAKAEEFFEAISKISREDFLTTAAETPVVKTLTETTPEVCP